MNIKNNFLNRMTRRKGSTPAEPEEGAYEIPPPSAIGQMASDSSRRAESMESGYGLDLELLASDKPPRPDSANGMNAQESGHAPALESSPQPISDESPDAPKPPRALEMHQEYGLELEVLAASESDESPDAPEPLEEHEDAGSGVGEITVEASESTPAILEESETEPPREATPFEEYGLDLELLTASESDESPDESEPSQDSEPFEGYGAGFEAFAVPGSSESPDEVVASHAPAPLPEDEVDPEVSVASESDESPDESEPPQEDDESASSMAASAAKGLLPGRKSAQESEPEAVPDPPREEPDEATEISLAEDRFYPLVRDARGNWRPGKGFSRSELQAAGLSLAEAARLRIRVDKRRRNAHRMNVATLEKAKNGG